MPPIPPMPPISGIAGAAASSLGTSVTMASVVIIMPATEPAACRAVLVTLAGSNIPISIISPYSPVAALKPKEPSPSTILDTITEASSPALVTICLNGASNAFLAILIPTFWSSLSPETFSTASSDLIKADPPPGTTAYSTAALVE